MLTPSPTLLRSETSAPQAPMFDRFAGAASIVAGGAGLLYAGAFVVLRNNLLSSLGLLLGGLLIAPVMIALYSRLRQVDAQWACLAVLLAGGGGLGSLLHGGYDLANTINPPSSLPGNLTNLPNAVDPRGLLTFGVAGLGILANAWLMGRSRQFPGGLVFVGYVLGLLLLSLYGGRLIVLDAASPLILGPALLTGFVVNPLWNMWLGLTLARRHAAQQSAAE